MSKPESLIQAYLAGEASAEEVAALDRLLAADPEVRRRLIFEAGLDAGLREIALERISEPVGADPVVVPAKFQPFSWLGAVAALVMLATLVGMHLSRPRVIAVMASVEDAAWEGSLPTRAGSELTRGELSLASGIATIRFRSGAEVTLEAPARLELISPMRTRLISGMAVIDVPDSALGFVLETPDGHAVDYGTRFAVQVSGAENSRSDFEVLSGEISVHHRETGAEVRLTDRQAASVSARGLKSADGPLPEKKLRQPSGKIRIGTGGRSTSIIRNDLRDEYLHPDFLMAKRSKTTSDFDRRSLMAFDLSGIDLDRVDAARLRLNLVPSGLGFRAHLPKMNRFEIYGVSDVAIEDWEGEFDWEAAPTPESGILLGIFEIPRSLEEGSFGIETAPLLDFLKTDTTGRITLVLVRETVEAEGRGLVHAFASDTHPQASGPILELSLKEAELNPQPETHE